MIDVPGSLLIELSSEDFLVSVYDIRVFSSYFLVIDDPKIFLSTMFTRLMNSSVL